MTKNIPNAFEEGKRRYENLEEIMNADRNRTENLGSEQRGNADQNLKKVIESIVIEAYHDGSKGERNIILDNITEGLNSDNAELKESTIKVIREMAYRNFTEYTYNNIEKIIEQAPTDRKFALLGDKRIIERLNDSEKGIFKKYLTVESVKKLGEAYDRNALNDEEKKFVKGIIIKHYMEEFQKAERERQRRFGYKSIDEELVKGFGLIGARIAQEIEIGSEKDSVKAKIRRTIDEEKRRAEEEYKSATQGAKPIEEIFGYKLIEMIRSDDSEVQKEALAILPLLYRK